MSLIARSKRVGISLTLLLVALSILLFIRSTGRPPQEARLIANFYAKRAAYEQLRRMLTADEQLREVYAPFGVETATSGRPRAASEVNFSTSRYAEYHALLYQVDGPSVFRSGQNSSDICVVAWAHGFGGDTRHVDYCWLDRAPVNQVASLEQFYKTPKPRHPVFRYIDGNWYLLADW
jgi:hypothetical protein